MPVNVLIESVGVSAGELASRLASAYERKDSAELDARKFSEQATREAGKLPELTSLLERVQARDKRLEQGLPPPETTSRMDPMLTYDASSIEAELKNTKSKALSLQTRASEAETLAARLGRDIKALQVEIKKANEAEAARLSKRASLGLPPR